MLDCLDYALMKENEIPRLIKMISNKLFGSESIETFNKHMRSAEEILKDYGL